MVRSMVPTDQVNFVVTCEVKNERTMNPDAGTTTDDT